MFGAKGRITLKRNLEDCVFSETWHEPKLELKSETNHPAIHWKRDKDKRDDMGVQKQWPKKETGVTVKQGNVQRQKNIQFIQQTCAQYLQ